MAFSELGGLETNTKVERDVVLRMFSRHYNMHSIIPDMNGTYRSAEQIHSDCKLKYICGVMPGIISVFGRISIVIGTL